MELFLIRHTAPGIEKGICYGQSDIPLAETFGEETARLVPFLPGDAQAVFSSPLSRCMRLANAAASGRHIIPDQRLMEMHFGEWEKKAWDNINPKQSNDWMADFVNYTVPGGESFSKLYARVENFIHDTLFSSAHQKTLIITHAGVIRCFLCKLLDVPLRNAFRLPVDHGSVTKMRLDKDNCGSRLEYLNFTPGK